MPSTPKVIIVTGSRDWDKSNVINIALTDAWPQTVVQGGAKGADWYAWTWAQKNRINYITIPANWNKFGKSAGHIRNELMLKQFPNAEVFAFLKDASRGTLNCIHKAKELGMKVTIFHYDNV